MASENKTARWKVVLGYAAFALVAFTACLLLTFPYEALRRRMVLEAADRGYALKVGQVRPGLRGLTLTQLRLSKVPGTLSPELRGLLLSGGPLPGPEQLGEPLTIPSLALRPTLFPLGVAFHAQVLGGTLSGSVGGLRSQEVELRLAGLELAKDNLPAFLEVELEGKVEGSVSLSIPPAQGRPAGPDYSQAEGSVTLQGRGLSIKGGKLTVPVYGQPTKVDLPAMALGDLEGLVRLEKGLGTVETLRTKGEDLELQGSGTLKLARQVELSELTLDIKLRVEPASVNKLGLLGAGLAVLPTDKDDPKFRAGRLSGVLSKPSFGPIPRR